MYFVNIEIATTPDEEYRQATKVTTEVFSSESQFEAQKFADELRARAEDAREWMREEAR